MPTDYELQAHRNWIGPLQPVGLVVSPPALANAQAFPDKNIAKQRQVWLDFNEQWPGFVAFAESVLGWKPGNLHGAPGGPSLPDTLDLPLPDFHETLRPSFAVPALKEEGADWQLLIQELPPGTPLDKDLAIDERHWQASPQARFERLLREKAVPIGILTNGELLRLIYAPGGETSGHISWPLKELDRVWGSSGRVLLSSLCMLLGSARLFSLPREQRLPQILKESRKYQNVVSTKLAGQVLEALNELLRGFQTANDATKGNLLDSTVREDPNHIYGGLLAVLLRLVFILYAEERGMLSSAAVYVRNYSLVALFEQLRVDAGRFPDTMDQRFGAWSRLLVLFRLVHDGAKRGEFHLPARYGHLFDPDGWAFLEGRPYGVSRVKGDALDVPKVPDGVVYRVLDKLLLLQTQTSGERITERLSYRALDVEQIGSVYENMMGFRLERAMETSIGLGKEHVVVGLDTILSKKGSDREKYLKETANVEFSDKVAQALKQARSLDEIMACMRRRISPLTPRPVPKGGLYLQPSDERRRSGSHYTPRELTEPIVLTTLRPILEGLGPNPKPEAILALKICDPAMGSGAFLVETCRQLGDHLVRAYDAHGRPGDVPPDEDIQLYAQRRVAQYCLYGVDKNQFAVDLGKLSLWLATLARDHAFTFLDHSIRHGDSLVGLSREQIGSFHWNVEHGLKQQFPLLRLTVDQAIVKAVGIRREIQELANSDDVGEKRKLLHEADDALAKLRTVGDCVIASFFSDDGAKARETAREKWRLEVQNWLLGKGDEAGIRGFVSDFRGGDCAVPSFHWEIEFPEVFGRSNGGFDALIGNPPYAHKNSIISESGISYIAYFQTQYGNFHGYSDLGAYFVRRTESLVATGGCWTLLCTKTITEGKARDSGLQAVLAGGATIISARTHITWPGAASVVVCAPTIFRGPWSGAIVLDEVGVDNISANLIAERAWAPGALADNKNLSSTGFLTYGRGFVVNIADATRMISENRANAEVVLPLLSATDFTSSPTLSPSQYVINFGTRSLDDATRYTAPFRWVHDNAREERQRASRPDARDRWWLLVGRAERVYAEALRQGLKRLLANLHVSKHHSFVFIPLHIAPEKNVNVFAFESFAALSILQSRSHEFWADRQASSLRVDRRYTTSTCFATFPFPNGWQNLSALELAGKLYYEHRSNLMIRSGEGITSSYNRFHDPDESDPEILRLRELHSAMDRAVLDAYGWVDLRPTCEFILDYEEDEDQDESTSKRRRKKPWRYRWPDEIRDEVLARLLELNAQRAKEEAAARDSTHASVPDKSKKKPKTPPKGDKTPPTSQGSFGF